MIYIIFISCEGKEYQDSDSSVIFSMIYDTLAKEIRTPFPPLPENYTREDSIKIAERVQDYRKSRENRKQIVAINPFLISGAKVEYSGSIENPDFHKLVTQLKTFKENKTFNTSMIKTVRTDSIIEYNQELQSKGAKDFENFDRLITFSRLVFNENKTEAALIASSSKSRLAGFSAAFFFRKEAGKWMLVESKELTIF